MKCSCGIEHRFEITEKSFQTCRKLWRYFKNEFLWALDKGRPRFIGELDPRDIPDIVLIEGGFEGEKLAYAVVNYSTADFLYIQRKPECDRERFGFHNEIMKHLLLRMPKDMDVRALMPFDFSQPMLKRFGFEPENPDNPKWRWALRRRPTSESL
jgi:hypothetical protein